MCEGVIDSVYHGSALDGEGWRSVIFLSGCNFRCPFCHNPETLYKIGKKVGVEETVKKILPYKRYYGGDGGVTISGGEPFLQADFCKSLIKELHSSGINVAIETNGSILDEELIILADHLIVDIKNQLKDNDFYKKFFGVCKEKGKKIWATNVLVPTVNDTKEKLNSLKELLASFDCIENFYFLPFKKICAEKYRELSLPFPYSDLPECTDGDIERAKSLIAL